MFTSILFFDPCKLKEKNDSFVCTEMLFVSLISPIDHFTVVYYFVALPLNESKDAFLLFMMLLSRELVGICTRKQ